MDLTPPLLHVIDVVCDHMQKLRCIVYMKDTGPYTRYKARNAFDVLSERTVRQHPDVACMNDWAKELREQGGKHPLQDTPCIFVQYRHR